MCNVEQLHQSLRRCNENCFQNHSAQDREVLVKRAVSVSNNKEIDLKNKFRRMQTIAAK